MHSTNFDRQGLYSEVPMREVPRAGEVSFAKSGAKSRGGMAVVKKLLGIFSLQSLLGLASVLSATTTPQAQWELDKIADRDNAMFTEQTPVAEAAAVVEPVAVMQPTAVVGPVAAAGPVRRMAAVRARLEEMGMGQYAETFENEGFDDLEWLRGLGHSRLTEVGKEIGMRSGHVMRFADTL